MGLENLRLCNQAMARARGEPPLLQPEAKGSCRDGGTFLRTDVRGYVYEIEWRASQFSARGHCALGYEEQPALVGGAA